MNDKYDAWGKLLAAKNYYGVPVTDPNSIALVNPLRYRGYVYDDETGLYYLQSRYYDPMTCRFFNSDQTVYLEYTDNLNNTNLFSYCLNNPVSNSDEGGMASNKVFKSYNYDISRFNCYAYAVGIYNKAISPGQVFHEKNIPNSYYFSTKYQWVIDAVYDILDDFPNNMRLLRGDKDVIYPGEYRIAFRLLFINGIYYDFHFWKQNPNNGAWWNKHGTGAIESLGFTYPGYERTKGWIAVPRWSTQRTVQGYLSAYNTPIFYNSATYYFAFKGKFWSR